MKLLLHTFVICTLYLCCTALNGFSKYEKSRWENHKVLDKKGEFQLYWTVNKDTISFKIEVEAKGWMVFALSKVAGVPDRDAIIGWLKDGKEYFFDYHIDKTGKFVKDGQQDWKLQSIKENKTHTIYKFSRKLDTCDIDDWSINFDTRHVHWDYSDKDPGYEDFVPKDISWKINHYKPLQPRVEIVPKPEGLMSWDIYANNFSLPGNRDTFYMCRIVKAPKLRRKHHVIKVLSRIQQSNREWIFRMVLYSCTPSTNAEGDAAMRAGNVECFQRGLPSLFSKCNNVYTVWAFDGSPVLYPKHIGLPLGGKGDEYFMFSIRYYNVDFLNNIVDNSGLKLYYTSQPRPNDAANLFMTSGLYPVIPIPPRQKEFILGAHASQECLFQLLPSDGIKVSSVFLYAHSYARKVQLRHFRENKELPPIAWDANFDYHYEQYFYLNEDRIVMPTDTLILECSFSTIDNTTTLLTGREWNQELCQANVVYHPPSKLGRTLSAPSKELVAGITGMDSSLPAYNASFPAGPSRVYQQYLENYDWPEEHMCMVQNAFRFSPQYQQCMTIYDTPIPVPYSTFPEPYIPYIPPDICKKMKRKPKKEDSFHPVCGFW